MTASFPSQNQLLCNLSTPVCTTTRRDCSLHPFFLFSNYSQHTILHYSIIVYIPYAVLYIPVTFYNRQFLFLNPFALFHPSPKLYTLWQSSVCSLYLSFCFVYFVLINLFFREGKAGRKGEETSMSGCLLCAPYWGPGLQPRHVP